ncbi:Coa1/Tim21 domain-containing protein [Zavarzinella formosa]|uniref:hypothetical protein n=1 Tax=Zavarzinella formosa TaxID=360055 RepID=UPI0002DEE4AA|nr:hypothetical protein [Zavarzinella formosa]
MAKVTLTEYECRKNLLPDVCMKCGEPADTRVKRNFSWYPPWVMVLVLAGVLVAAIVALILTKKMSVRAPMCDLHKDHWSKRTMWTLITFGILAVLGIGGIVILGAVENGPNKDSFTGLICGGGVFGLLAWLILVVIFQSTMIKPTLITDKKITLVKVHPEFVRALEDDRAADEDDDDQPPPRKKKFDRRDDDDDE